MNPEITITIERIDDFPLLLEVTLTIVHLPDQTIRHITPLTPLQTRILELLGLSAAVYTRLAENCEKSKPFQRMDRNKGFVNLRSDDAVLACFWVKRERLVGVELLLHG